MQGQVLEVEAVRRSGLILGGDGIRYSFGDTDWKSRQEPAAGMPVDFMAAGGRATEIYALTGQSTAPVRQAAVADGASVTLGVVGIACLVLGFVIPVLPTIAAFILGLVGADSAKRHDNGTGLVLSRIAWIGALAMLVIGVLLLLFAFSFAWPFLQVMLDSMLDLARERAGRTV